MDYITVLAEEQGLQSVYTPTSLKVHFVFCIIATVLYLTQFYRRGSWHYIAIMAAIDLTFATQIESFQNQKSIAVLGIIEIVLLALAAVLYFFHSKNHRSAVPEENEDDIAAKKKRTAERIQKNLDSRPVDNAFDDEDGL